MPQSLLPAPAGRLKYVVLGVGTQNYTCNGDENDAPGTTGAMGKRSTRLVVLLLTM
jgi:hypothetical protein